MIVALLLKRTNNKVKKTANHMETELKSALKNKIYLKYYYLNYKI